ncbi:mitochondrial half-size ABC transporter, membrane protein [Haematococcus lacustris]|uniref:Mitochondrial half-size ABC transporter, membrane protein n=1 Tax=Haematococcus lacustris TaxID=44745 RepID=A0A699Z8Y4_HAELA|nr:mitochondrial half-size ABC transporter, membrane protein [Haematococcus lacustris]
MWPAALAAWCDVDADSGFVIAGVAITPCLVESCSGCLVLFGLALTLVLNAGRLRQAAELRRSKAIVPGPIGRTGPELGAITATGFIALLHLLHLGAALALHLPLWHCLLHGCLAATWGLAAILHVWASKVHVALDMRALAGCSLLMYGWALQSYWSLYRAASGFPLPYQRSTIWTLLLQTLVTAIICTTDYLRRKVTPPEGYQQLATGDVEAGKPGALATSSSTPAPLQHSWLALFWDACTYVWPEDPWLQLRAITAFALLLSMRVLNLAVPILYKKLVDALAGLQQANEPGAAEQQGSATQAWLLWGWLSAWVPLYLVAILFQGGAGGGMVGVINNLRQLMWIPVSQDAYRRISLRIFKHVMDLDLGFHLSRKTGEVTKQVDRGTNAMQNILATILFSILPTCIDVLTASTYLAQALEPTIALTVFVTVGSYIPVTILITEWRTTLRREMNRTDQAQAARVTDALLNWETVKYFTNEQHEHAAYAAAIADYQSAEFKSQARWIGITLGLLVCSKGVRDGELTVGDVVLFLSLMAQLYGPLNWFGAYYRTISQYVIDLENLFQLLEKQGAVRDAEGAPTLAIKSGEVQFDDVTFQYENNHPVLRNVSFTAPGGSTLAFVGATGSGKSTITRLVFRFYDVTSGAIRVDGQDIRHVTQGSLRKAVGMVPQARVGLNGVSQQLHAALTSSQAGQASDSGLATDGADCVLFNDTILHNIRYGNLSASDEQVHEAAQAACIHEAITTRFPKGYDTMVGERGLRLSGGEKQRVAFARALLKNPAILVLDEATSALDTLTERRIQAALAAMRSSRTTLIVAHRLSTIVDADTIVVLRLGQVRVVGTGGSGSRVEEIGSHSELLARQGLYHEMWTKQASGASADNDSAASSSISRPGSALHLPALAAVGPDTSALVPRHPH